MPEIEILPWIHDINLNSQAQAITYIKNLPKNSIILMEIDDSHINGFNDIPNFLKAKGIDTSIAAVLEVYLECQKRNIVVLPLDNANIIKKIFDIRDREKLSGAKEAEFTRGFNAIREQVMLSRILSALKLHPKKNISVLIGGEHHERIYKALVENTPNGYSIKVNETSKRIYELFSKQHYFEPRYDTNFPWIHTTNKINKFREQQKQRIQKKLQKRKRKILQERLTKPK